MQHAEFLLAFKMIMQVEHGTTNDAHLAKLVDRFGQLGPGILTAVAKDDLIHRMILADLNYLA